MLLLCNCAAIVWLALCYLSSITHPEKLKYIALFSLTLPFALAANFVFVCIWLFSKKKLRSLLSAIALALCWKMIPAVFGLHYFSNNDWSHAPGTFKLMTWNVHAMGTFNSPHEKEYAKGVMQFVKDENPDIVCMPEFAINATESRKAFFNRIIREGHYADYRFNMDNGYGPDIAIGTAIFSRYPIVRYTPHELSPYIFLLECDINIEGNLVKFGIVHLITFGLTDADKAVIEEVKQDQNKESISRSRSFIWKFNNAYVRRAAEAEKIRAIMSNSPYPVIICGDFNDLPYSYTYRTVRGALNDAFVEKGRGFGRSYNQIVPTLRIDHIFYTPGAFNIRAFKTPYSALSDHSPIIANFEIVNKATQ